MQFPFVNDQNEQQQTNVRFSWLVFFSVSECLDHLEEPLIEFLEPDPAFSFPLPSSDIPFSL